MTKFIKMANGDIVRSDVITAVKYVRWGHKEPNQHVVAVSVLSDSSGMPSSQFFQTYEFASEQECKAEIDRISSEL